MFPLSIRILMVDDDPTMQKQLGKLLNQLGYNNITSAPSAEKALQMLSSTSEGTVPFDLIISDWKMTGLSGFDLLLAIRKRSEWENIPFIFVSSVSNTDQILTVLQAGANNYLLKPVMKPALQEKLQRTWDHLQARTAP